MVSPIDGASDLRLVSGSTTLRLTIAKDPESNTPLWTKGSTPKLPNINNTNPEWQSAQPQEADDYVIDDFSGGAGYYNHRNNGYALASNMETKDGRAILAQALVTDSLDPALGGALNGRIAGNYLHPDPGSTTLLTDWIIAGIFVYYFSLINLRWQKTVANPGISTLTDIASFNGNVYVCDGATYRYSNDYGATWSIPTAGGVDDFKFFLVREQETARPILSGVINTGTPKLHTTENPTNTNFWDSGSVIAPDSNYLITGLAMDPGKQYVLISRTNGLYGMDSTGRVSLLYGPVPVGAGVADNLKRPARLGNKIIYTLRERRDVIIWENGRIRDHVGPRFQGDFRITELQGELTALSGDVTEDVFIAIFASDGFGYVFRGVSHQEKGLVWHGSICSITDLIAHMWVTASGASSSTKYLLLAPEDSPYTPRRLKLLDYDVSLFTLGGWASSGFIRTGYIYPGRKLTSKSIHQVVPYFRNISSANPLTQAYRKDEQAAFTQIGNAIQGTDPLPATWSDTKLPAGTLAQRIELRETITHTLSAQPGFIESITLRTFPRPSRSEVIQVTILADTGTPLRAGGEGDVGAQGLRSALFAARDVKAPPTLHRDETSESWLIDILDIQETWVKHSQGEGSSMAFNITYQELPDIEQYT